jgi:hypothetical protein
MDRKQSRKGQGLEQEFDPDMADCGYWAPLSPPQAFDDPTVQMPPILMSMMMTT